MKRRREKGKRKENNQQEGRIQVIREQAYMKEKFGRILRKTLENIDGKAGGKGQYENTQGKCKCKEEGKKKGKEYKLSTQRCEKRRPSVPIIVKEINAIAIGSIHS